jgi:signal transduction histidine kinase
LQKPRVAEHSRDAPADRLKSFPFTHRIRSVRGGLFLLIAALVVPAFGIVAVLSWEAYRNQQAAVRTELLNTARAVAGLVDTEIDRARAMLETIAATRAMHEKDWAGLDSMARRILPDDRRWLVIVDMQGRQIVNSRLPLGSALPHLELDPTYVATLGAGRDFVSDLVFGPAAQGLVVHIGRPFVDERGELHGISIVAVPDAWGASLDVRRFAPGGIVTIIDRTGKIIARNPNDREFVGRSATADMVQVTQRQAEGVGESVTLEGIPVLTAFAHAKCGWSVLIGTPKARLLASTQRLFFLGLGSALGVAALAVGLALVIARAVVRSVEGLARDAERLARGETPASPESGLAEIHIISRAMQQMAATRMEAEVQLREARDRLRDYAEELERKVEDRTASLRDAMAQMEEFSYTVSHDLRGPLRAMNGYANVLLEEHGANLGAEARDFLRRILRASERMNQLTTDLLNYSRVARADLPRERVALEPLLRGILDHYAELAPAAADITLATPLDDVLGHETSLTQALANLLTNAAKFVRPGERPHITVRTERRGERVRVWVEDEGIGVDVRYQHRLFRMFERAHVDRGYDGTGVGLAIVRKVVEKSGGTCGVESDGRSGSRFWIELPAAADRTG